MPGYAGYGAPDGLLQVLGYPPIIFFFEVTYGDQSGAGSDGEFGLRGCPADAGCCAVDAEEDEGWFPALRGGFPYVGVSILRTCNNLAGIGRNVDACHRLVMSLELIAQLELVARPLIQVHCVLAGDGEGLPVGGEGVVGDGVVEEVVDFRGCHGGGCLVGR